MATSVIGTSEHKAAQAWVNGARPAASRGGRGCRGQRSGAPGKSRARRGEDDASGYARRRAAARHGGGKAPTRSSTSGGISAHETPDSRRRGERAQGERRLSVGKSRSRPAVCGHTASASRGERPNHWRGEGRGRAQAGWTATEPARRKAEFRQDGRVWQQRGGRVSDGPGVGGSRSAAGRRARGTVRTRAGAQSRVEKVVQKSCRALSDAESRSRRSRAAFLRS